MPSLLLNGPGAYSDRRTGARARAGREGHDAANGPSMTKGRGGLGLGGPGRQ